MCLIWNNWRILGRSTPEQKNHTRSHVIYPFLVHHYNKPSLSDVWLGAENMILNRLVVIVTGNVTYVPQTLQSLYMYPLQTTTIRLWYSYQTNTFSIYLKLITLVITHCCWHDRGLFFTANVMFIKLCNKYFHCKLHLIAVILHLYDFLNPPTLFVSIYAFQTYISKFMMILLVYVLVRFQVIGQNLYQMQKEIFSFWWRFSSNFTPKN